MSISNSSLFFLPQQSKIGLELVRPLCVSSVRVSDVSHNLDSSCKITNRAVMISILWFSLLRSRNFFPNKFSWTDDFCFFLIWL